MSLLLNKGKNEAGGAEVSWKQLPRCRSGLTVRNAVQCSVNAVANSPEYVISAVVGSIRGKLRGQGRAVSQAPSAAGTNPHEPS